MSSTNSCFLPQTCLLLSKFCALKQVCALTLVIKLSGKKEL